MGFSQKASTKALYNGLGSINEALNWLLEHCEDADL